MFKKTRARLAAVSAIAFSLLLYLYLLFILFLPGIVNVPSLRDQIETLSGRRLDAAVSIDRLQLEYFPLPVLSVRGLDVQGNNSAWSLQAETVRFAANLEALADLKLMLGHVSFSSPRVRITWPEIAGPGASGGKRHPIDQAMQELINSVPLGLSLNINDGSVELAVPDRQTVFSNIQARLDLSSNPRLELRCTSNLWQSMSLEARGDLPKRNAQTTVRISGFQPTAFLDELLRETPFRVIPEGVDLSLDATLPDFSSATGQMQLSLPGLGLARGSNRVDLARLAASGSFSLQESKVELNLQELTVRDPGLTISGRLSFPLDRGPLAVQLVQGFLDLDEARKTCLDLFPEQETVRAVFQSIKSGSLKDLRLTSSGRSAAELAKSLSAEATLLEARLDIPQPNLKLSQVQGRLVYANEVIVAENVVAALEGLRTTSARIVLGLDPFLSPFSLSTGFQGDLSRMEGILRTVVPLDRFRTEMDRLSILQGETTGNLRVAKDPSSGWTFSVEAGSTRFTAKYAGLPYPVSFQADGLEVDDSGLSIQGVDAALQESRLAVREARVDWTGREPLLVARTGEGRMNLSVLLTWLKELSPKPLFPEPLEDLTGWLLLDGATFQGPLPANGQWDISASGRVRDLKVTSKLLPEPMLVESGQFGLKDGELSLTGWQAAILDSRVTLDSSSRAIFSSGLPATLEVEGLLGEDTLDWAQAEGYLPGEVALQGPVRLKDTLVSLESRNRTSFSGRLATEDGLVVEVAGSKARHTLAIQRLLLDDAQSTAILGLTWSPEQIDLSFRGHLEESSLRKLTVRRSPFTGMVDGDVSLQLKRDPIRLSHVRGGVVLSEARADMGDLPPLRIDRLEISSRAGSRLTILPSRLSWLGSPLSVNGNVTISKGKNLLDLQIVADTLNATALTASGRKDAASGNTGPGKGLTVLSSLQGRVELYAKEIQFEQRRLSRADVTTRFLPEGRVEVSLNQGWLCSLPIEAVWRSAKDGTQNCTASIAAEQKELKPVLDCLFARPDAVSGSFDLEGHASTDCQSDGLLPSLKGSFRFTAQDGRIYRLNLLAKIFSLLNTTEILVGKLPDLNKEGFGYSSMIIQGNLDGKTLQVTEGLIDGDSMELAFQGPIDLSKGTLDMQVLASPLKTVDRLFKKIPVVSGLLGGNLISIPIRVSGDLTQPTVVPLSPTAISQEVFNILKRTIKLPITVIQPFIPGDNGQGESEDSGAEASP